VAVSGYNEDDAPVAKEGRRRRSRGRRGRRSLVSFTRLLLLMLPAAAAFRPCMTSGVRRWSLSWDSSLSIGLGFRRRRRGAEGGGQEGEPTTAGEGALRARASL
jgi:hypothetical protein